MSIFDTPAETTPDAGATDLGGDTTTSDPVAASTPDADLGVAADQPPAGIPQDQGPVPQYLSVDEYGDHLVKVKVDGEERELPFKDAVNGVMMQQAFTQRTQQLAEERRKFAQAQALVDALESNPASVLKELADVYDLDPESGFTPIERTQQELQFRQMQAEAQQIQAQLARQRFDSEVAALRQEFGADIDLQAAARHAYERGMSITDAYKAVQFEQLRQQQAQQAEAQRRQQAAAAAAAATHTAGSNQRGAVSTPPVQVNSIRDAFLAAKRAHT